ncbi:MAG: hypothetical protein O6826_05835 [Acidobacteria bacterium]|nr:hypothetical protein [Acidobacteriota bacterium]
MTAAGSNLNKLNRTTALLLGVAVVGALAFAVGVEQRPTQTWKIFLVNFLFWSGISISGVVFSAIFQLTNARWAARQVRTVAESFACFLPLSLLLYLLLVLAGAASLYPWIADPPAARAGWFSLPFLALRDGIALLLLYGVGGKFLLASRQNRREESPRPANLSALAVLTIVLYALVFSLVTIDLVMSLDPYWVSTLFPAYFFMGNLCLGIAALAAASFLWRRWTGVEEWLSDAAAHDLGKLLLGFSLLWTYLLWSQFIVIWYGNLPEELRFLVVRTTGSWGVLSWIVLTMCFVIPFTALLTRRMKRPAPLFVIALITVVGIWLERFWLVVPSPENSPAFSWVDILITLGFLALFALSQVFLGPRLGAPFSDKPLTELK